MAKVSYLRNHPKRKGKTKSVSLRGTMANSDWIALFDRAAQGDLDAAYALAESYWTGAYGEKNLKKAEKWALYASRKGHRAAPALLEKMQMEKEKGED